MKTRCPDCRESSTGRCRLHRHNEMEMKMTKRFAAHTTRGRVATHKNSFPKKQKPERIESINVTLSVERLAGWTKEDLVARLTDDLIVVGEALGGDNGPRFNVEAGPNSIVEITDGQWRTIDIEPIPKQPAVETTPRLLYKNGTEVKVGDRLRDGYRVTGWAPPHTPASSGRVYVQKIRKPKFSHLRQDESYFPNVFDMAFEKECEACGLLKKTNENGLCAGCQRLSNRSHGAGPVS